MPPKRFGSGIQPLWQAICLINIACNVQLLIGKNICQPSYSMRRYVYFTPLGTGCWGGGQGVPKGVVHKLLKQSSGSNYTI